MEIDTVEDGKSQGLTCIYLFLSIETKPFCETSLCKTEICFWFFEIYILKKWNDSKHAL